MNDEKKIFCDYLDHLAHIKKYSANTLKAYRQDIEQFHAFLQDRGFTVKNVSRDVVREFMSLIFTRTQSKTTVSRKIFALKSFYGFLLQADRVDKNPFEGVHLPKIEKRMPHILTEREMIAFLDTLPENTYLQLRNKAILEFLYATGLRVSELANLKVGDVHFNEGLLRVLGKGKKERIVPFNDQAKVIVQKYRQAARKRFGKDHESLFLNSRGGKITERSVERIVQNCYRDQVHSDKTVYPHLIRHSFATHLLQRGANLRVIQELLGHSNLATTEKYTNLNYVDLLRAYRKFHPRG